MSAKDRRRRGNKMDWINYVEQQPTVEGLYAWRVPSAALKGEAVTFLAHMRMRGAGYTQALSPQFDYWDGYSLHVPSGTQWKNTEPDEGVKKYCYGNLSIEGIENEPCPFCGMKPVWHAIHSSGGSTLLNAKPHEKNRWWLECCDWAKTPHSNNPRKLAEQRNSLLRGVKL